MRVYFIELTVPWEELVPEAYERKKSLGMWSWGQKQSSEDGKLGSVQWK